VVAHERRHKPQDFIVDVNSAFELPPGAPKTYEARSPWQEDREKPSIALSAGVPYTLQLRPFQVLTLEASPKD
jgi:hypothetical protein